MCQFRRLRGELHDYDSLQRQALGRHSKKQQMMWRDALPVALHDARGCEVGRTAVPGVVDEAMVASFRGARHERGGGATAGSRQTWRQGQMV